MLVESIVALALIGIVLAGLSEGHQITSSLFKKASNLEDRESDAVSKFYSGSQGSINCSSSQIIPNVVSETCCEVEVGESDSKRSISVCRLSSDAGQSIVSFLTAMLFLSLVGTLSYPTIRQLLVEKKQLKESLSDKLSITESLTEIERRVRDVQAIGLKDLVRVMPSSDPTVNPSLNLANADYRPNGNSSVLQLTEIDFKNIIFPQSRSTGNGNFFFFSSCQRLPRDSTLIAALFVNGWEMFELTRESKINIAGCDSGLQYSVASFSGETIVYSPGALLALAPIIDSKLYYLDNAQSLRSFSLIQKKTTPLDHNFSKFLITKNNNQLEFEVVKQHNSIERVQHFNIELEAPNDSQLLSLLL